MAEFKEVLQDLERMCDSSTCKTCELDSSTCCSILVDVLKYDNDAERIERVALKWAAEHPEPKLVYPTFAEWQKEMFPEGAELLRPCLFRKRTTVCVGRACAKCAEQTRIPEDVARKLGIEPKEKT